MRDSIFQPRRTFKQANERGSEQENERTNERTKKETNELTNERTNEQTKRRTNDRRKKRAYTSLSLLSQRVGKNVLRGRLETTLFKMAVEASCPIFIVDAFTDKPFGGNPAAVCLVGSRVRNFQ